jgi:RHS repeat-associated protein
VAAGSHASNAPFTIKHSTGSATVLVNQRLNGGQWMLLGTYTFNAGTAGTVTLTDKANGTVIADAVKLVPTGGGTTQEAIRYLHTDQLNTPRLATDAAQQVLWRWDGNAFGDSAPNQDPDGDGTLTTVNLRYPGQYFDRETGLHYNWNRYYDPKTGRYVSSDPIGLDGGMNTYAYANLNPLRFTDPLGLDVNVCYYPGVIPHIGFGFRNEEGTQGFRPTFPSPLAPGEVSKDPLNKPRECKTVPSREDQDKCMVNCRLTRRDNPGIYHVGARQCTSFVRACMRECGIPTGISPIGDSFQGPRPDRFYEKLPGTSVSYP